MLVMVFIIIIIFIAVNIIRHRLHMQQLVFDNLLTAKMSCLKGDPTTATPAAATATVVAIVLVVIVIIRMWEQRN